MFYGLGFHHTLNNIFLFDLTFSLSLPFLINHTYFSYYQCLQNASLESRNKKKGKNL